VCVWVCGCVCVCVCVCARARVCMRVHVHAAVLVSILAKWMKTDQWHCSQGGHVGNPGGGHVVVAGTGGLGVVPLTNCED
jgi:hypothetical protein